MSKLISCEKKNYQNNWNNIKEEVVAILNLIIHICRDHRVLQYLKILIHCLELWWHNRACENEVPVEPQYLHITAVWSGNTYISAKIVIKGAILWNVILAIAMFLIQKKWSYPNVEYTNKTKIQKSISKMPNFQLVYLPKYGYFYKYWKQKLFAVKNKWQIDVIVH
jgi:hypothetical protein